MGEPTVFIDDAAVAARSAEVPAASFANGMNLGGSNAAGVGINMNEGAVVGEPQQFTLLDQGNLADGFTPAPRVPQTSQHIGGYPYVAAVAYPSSGGVSGVLPEASIRFGTTPTNAAKEADPALDGTLTPIANSVLNSLAEGWVAAV